MSEVSTYQYRGHAIQIAVTEKGGNCSLSVQIACAAEGHLPVSSWTGKEAGTVEAVVGRSLSRAKRVVDVSLGEAAECGR
ncbi:MULTISPECIES: hypothetical protein [Cupriavidus]|uniref:hypothetical protein n=1 Tax=Cupriavidus sp. DF5525 TaxID=3160989 RepID=UPI0032E00B32